MAMVCRPKLRFRRPSYYGKVNALPLILCPPTTTSTSPIRETAPPRKKMEVKEVPVPVPVKEHRFVRVDDRLFKVPAGFFLQMPLQIRDSLLFSSGRGSTPEKPIFLTEHSEDQFKQILSAYNAFPSLDANSFTLDHLLTVGELSFHYGMRDLIQWFLTAFRKTISGPHSPLWSTSDKFFVRMMKLALRMRSLDLVGTIQTTWAGRMHTGGLSPVWAILFADMYGLRDLLGHACYAYLMGVHAKLKKGENFNERGMLQPRQVFYIRAGYHSLRTYWDQNARHPPDFEQSPDCTLHEQCVRVWKLRWAAFLDRPWLFPDVDVLNRLGVMLERLKADMVLDFCLSSPCKTSALSALAKKRDLVSRQLHHHFDI